MTPMRPVFTFLLLSLLLLSRYLPSSAASSQFDEVLTKSQLPQGRQNDAIRSLQSRKLGIYMRKKVSFLSSTHWSQIICYPNPNISRPCDRFCFYPPRFLPPLVVQLGALYLV
ncbi:hypothetical protein OIU76_009370 [Salix suchowensis]|nr:hypothetical protein OIU76_009370 [Salix suchowensis]